MADSAPMKTEVLPIDSSKIGKVTAVPDSDDLLDSLSIELDDTSQDALYLRGAAEQLSTSDIPVAFPTETVYGLGADATRSQAVRGIYKAKQRPVDNPLIVHFSSLQQLRALLQSRSINGTSEHGDSQQDDPIPAIYRPLIKTFWPGPLTIILPNPQDSKLAPEVTAGLSTFGARMPGNVLALALIHLAGVPVAAPSANASTKPSPTAAEHVAYDLDGRIEIIVDGGPCTVGVESTVVDGLNDPPLILRPGGISLEQLRECSGWEDVQIGYKNQAESGSQPRAPGMKYRHYSPKAPVILFEAGRTPPTPDELSQYAGKTGSVGVVSTRQWMVKADSESQPIASMSADEVAVKHNTTEIQQQKHLGFAGLLETVKLPQQTRDTVRSHQCRYGSLDLRVLELPLGPDVASVARGIFAALRELDKQNVDAIFVEGIDDAEGETAAAIMNRLRKAAEVKVGG